jgi:peptidoglycan hydrolase-like protein with peptidoglycan-binding domain
MKLRTATHLALALLVAAGLGVSADLWAGQGTTKRKAATSKASSTAKGSSGKRTGKKTTKSTAASRGRKKGQQAPTSDRITEIQQALAKDGSYNGEPTGKWDDSTVAAMKKFQDSHGLNPSGKLDAKTLQQLGLGSQTAGVAAPMPPVSSSSTASPTRTVASKQTPEH